MKKTEINRAIAENLEAEPWATRLGFWKYDSTTLPFGANQADYYFDLKYWLPFDPFHSESANARLLEAMTDPADKKHVAIESSVSGDWHSIYMDSGITQWIADWNKDRKTAVVLAACKWLNIDPGTEWQEKLLEDRK